MPIQRLVPKYSLPLDMEWPKAGNNPRNHQERNGWTSYIWTRKGLSAIKRNQLLIHMRRIEIMMLRKFRQKDYILHASMYVRFQKIKLIYSDGKWTRQGSLRMGKRQKDTRELWGWWISSLPWLHRCICMRKLTKLCTQTMCHCDRPIILQ